MRPQPRPEQPIPSALAPALLRPPCAADTFIQRTKKLYVDTRTQRNLNKLNEELSDVQDIMKQNIQDVLGRGERLDTVMNKSSALRDASGKYAKDARHLNMLALLRKWAPIAAIGLVVFGCLWWRFLR